MKKSIFVSGSIAYDFIMKYEGQFKDAILKEHLNHLNVAFLAKEKVMHFGGCSGNIVYNLNLLGESGIMYSVVGKDFEEYENWLKENDIRSEFIGRDNDNFTASAYVLTDKRGNQITMFSPGAMENNGCEVALDDDFFDNVSLAILSPDVCERTIRLAKKCISKGVPYFFDPGQVIHVFEVKDLKFLLKNAYGFIANHYEVKLLMDILKIDVNAVTKQVDIFIETLGEKGSILRIDDSKIKIPPVKTSKVVDPTGCGDAFRGGILAGLNSGIDPIDACKVGALIATYSVENKGTQSHKFDIEEFRKRYSESFKGEKCPL